MSRLSIGARCSTVGNPSVGPAGDALGRRIGRDEVGMLAPRAARARAGAGRTLRPRSRDCCGCSRALRDAGSPLRSQDSCSSGELGDGPGDGGPFNDRGRARSPAARAARRAHGSGERSRGRSSRARRIRPPARRRDRWRRCSRKQTQDFTPLFRRDGAVVDDRRISRSASSPPRCSRKMIGSVTLPSRRSPPIGLPSASRQRCNRADRRPAGRRCRG